jgi:hypothetical protein
MEPFLLACIPMFVANDALGVLPLVVGLTQSYRSFPFS